MLNKNGNFAEIFQYTYGGLPHVLTLETEKKKLDYLSNLFESVYLLDILERHRVKNKSEFEDLVRIVASSIVSCL